MLERIVRLVRIDTLNAILEMATRVQIASGDIDEAIQDIKAALGFEMDLAANERIRMWQAH